MSRPVEEYPIVIVGAGAAGLYCARELKRHFEKVGGAHPPIIVVEASVVAGGRMMSSKDLEKVYPILQAQHGPPPPPTFLHAGSNKTEEMRNLVKKHPPIDIGAEFIHGDGTLLMDLFREYNLKIRKVVTWAQGDGEPLPVANFQPMYYLGDERKLVSALDLESKPHLKQVNDLLFSLSGVTSAPLHITLFEYLKSKGVAPNGQAMQLVEAGYANTFCSSIHRLKMDAVIDSEKYFCYEDGDHDFRCGEEGKCLASTTVGLLSEGQDIRLDWRVLQIQLPPLAPPQPIRLVNQKGEELLASRVLLTPNPPVMKDIQFVPPLPLHKQKALTEITIENAMKLIIFFKKPFWPKEILGVVCTHSKIPELWFDSDQEPAGLCLDAKTGEERPYNPPAESDRLWRCVGFTCGKFADRMRNLPEPEAIEIFLTQLDEMFAEATGNPRCAHDHYQTHLTFCWGDHPYIRGGYSNTGVSPSVRRDLAEPYQNRLFFAGEATNLTTMTAIHCAMTTGVRASKEIIASLEPVQSRL